eukprot:4723108-Alexandrium_andersonii.AAC.1
MSWRYLGMGSSGSALDGAEEATAPPPGRPELAEAAPWGVTGDGTTAALVGEAALANAFLMGGSE